MTQASLNQVKSHIPKLTVGKIQLRPIADVLRFDRVMMRDVSPEAVFRLIQENKDLEEWIRNEIHLSGKARRFVEAALKGDGTYWEDGRGHRPSPSVLRTLIYRLFSANQRGGGSRISGYPLIELDPNKYVGMEAFYRIEKEIMRRGDDAYDGLGSDDVRRLSGYHIKIGRPYAKKLIQATSLVAKGIDRVSANLSVEVKRRRDIGESIGVEDLSVWCCDNLSRLMAVPEGGGRFIAKVDFLLCPPASLREEVLNKGSVNEALAKELREALQKGEFCLSAIDISGGGAGVGISETVARHWGFESSGNLQAYVEHLLHAYYRLNARPPTQVVIMPRTDEYRTFGSEEYIPLRAAFRERGYPSYIVTSEMYQEQLSGNSGRVRIGSVDGEDIIMGGDHRTLVVRRYTYLRERQEGLRGVIPLHPRGTTVLPSDESRIVASDCRVNLRMLDRVTKPLRGSQDENQNGPFQIIPFAFLKLGEPNAAYAAQGFLASCMDQWPEVKYLGGVAKPVDKVLVSKGGGVRSAYPLPPIPTNRDLIDRMVEPLFRNLLEKGVGEIVVMPNVLPVVVDQHHRILPKFEVRMISLGA
jgi:hypothetical protein